ncbi:hypothetical protein [Cohnella herbarum]|uniref:DUF4136 domain-containing protein n=1 Tax=Cohnella herbarum TaxID=2728023 RepID=A0A7Z2VHQ2_9BACL|nr:hypothetical protein [Cohnella herbarum]QJD83217.1 hypothetical protein HH215_08550 [Cohnella herbarum]
MKLLIRCIVFCLLIMLMGSSKSEYPKDFNFIFRYGVMTKNLVDTFSDKYTKDLVQDGVVTTGLTLSNDEKKRIYEYMKKIDFFHYPEEIEGMNLIPSSGYILEIQYNGKVKVFKWTGEFNEDKKHQEFRGLTKLIIEILESKESYQSLPDSKGGYL